MMIKPMIGQVNFKEETFMLITMYTVVHDNPLLEHLNRYLFSDGKNPVIVSSDSVVFQLIASAFSSANLMKVITI